eukprot:CAMPEP_0198224366 /NCGR_PEP_ID=MMETSP1445-20131203/96600_1 /TAXON_ID=36898 /ORGANISM="Pyramimonas sp., Strain CCMP2087" /LENGTH=90 /DNA_ID=CAMNT_0043903513 /DNA_START=81 /DNA_END=350 /DNA_ORIENTATION=-
MTDDDLACLTTSGDVPLSCTKERIRSEFFAKPFTPNSSRKDCIVVPPPGLVSNLLSNCEGGGREEEVTAAASLACGLRMLLQCPINNANA